MKTSKKLLAAIISLCLLASLFSGCAQKDENTLVIAYQGGIGYAPIHVLEAKQLIKKHYDGKLTVEFKKLDSGAVINEGVIGGNIDIGCMGVAPAISGVANGVGYKAISNLCSQSHGLMSNDPNITKLSDIKSDDKIALVNTGSIQHILLSMASEKYLGDVKALDNNIQPMAHAEGMAALDSGTVKLHLTSSPFIYQERANPDYNELTEIGEVWPSENSFLVAMASSKLQNDEKLFDAVSKGLEEAFQFIQDNPEEFAEIEAEYLELDIDTVKSYLADEDCQFFSELKGVETMAEFMERAGFIEKKVAIDNFKCDNVSVAE